MTSTWQDFATAPQDGSSVLAVWVQTDHEPYYAIVAWNGDRWTDGDIWQGTNPLPTFWRPLPPVED